jgi:hypothetical protein
MKPRSRLSRVRLLVAVATTLACSAPAWADRRDWTDAEVACAESLGIDLRAAPEPGSSGYVKRLAWLADLVVYGKVSKVRKNVEGAHPAQVRIKVTAAKKGRPASGRLTVALASSSPRSPSLDRILEGRFDDEPPFAKGETVLLFLAKADSDDVYFLVDDSKFLVDEDQATLQGWSGGVYNAVRSEYQIREVVEAQSTNCR